MRKRWIALGASVLAAGALFLLNASFLARPAGEATLLATLNEVLARFPGAPRSGEPVTHEHQLSDERAAKAAHCSPAACAGGTRTARFARIRERVGREARHA